MWANMVSRCCALQDGMAHQEDPWAVAASAGHRTHGAPRRSFAEPEPHQGVTDKLQSRGSAKSEGFGHVHDDDISGWSSVAHAVSTLSHMHLSYHFTS